MKNSHCLSLASLFLLSLTLWGCSSIETDPTYKDKTHDDMYEYGSLASQEGGFKLFDTDEEKQVKNTGIGVNGFLWRAALDTLSFLPIATADPFGGVITTDWYSADNNKNERIRLNVLILDRNLRADGIKITVFRQTRGEEEGAEWEQAPVASATGSSLEDTILSRARQLRLAQKKKDEE